jgi:hypothetical protein
MISDKTLKKGLKGMCGAGAAVLHAQTQDMVA